MCVQPHQHWNCFERNCVDIADRWDGMCMRLSEPCDAIFSRNWTLQDFIFVLRGKENLAVTQMTNTNIHNGPDPDARPPPPLHTHTHMQACINAHMLLWRHKHTLLYITIHVRYKGRTEKHYVKNAVRKMHLLYQHKSDCMSYSPPLSLSPPSPPPKQQGKQTSFAPTSSSSSVRTSSMWSFSVLSRVTKVRGFIH